MNKFELYSLIYFALEKFSQENPLEEREIYLSGMCPFTFDDIGSADPEIYEDFAFSIEDETINIDKSYCVAKGYVESLKLPYITEAFEWVTENHWNESVRKYLSKMHKGKD